MGKTYVGRDDQSINVATAVGSEVKFSVVLSGFAIESMQGAKYENF